METRAAIAEYDAKRGTDLDDRQARAATGWRRAVPEHPENSSRKMRVICRVGGGVRPQLFPYREYAWSHSPAQLRKIVNMAADRADHFMGDGKAATTSPRPGWARRGWQIPWPGRRSLERHGRVLSAFGPTFRMAAPACCPAFTTSRPPLRVRTVFTNTVPGRCPIAAPDARGGLRA